MHGYSGYLSQAFIQNQNREIVAENLCFCPYFGKPIEMHRKAVERYGGTSRIKKKTLSAVQTIGGITEFGVDAFRYALQRLKEDGAESGWWTYFPVHKQDNKLIGSGGYKGRPTEEGTVEIGYEIAPTYRNKGLATEMATALISNAFADDRVKSIIAHTLSEENASTRVLAKCGFEKIEEVNDPADGLIWKWQLKRP